MTYRLIPYVWDVHKPGHQTQIPGVKISTTEEGTERFLFVPNTELFDVAMHIADYIEAQQPDEKEAA